MDQTFTVYDFQKNSVDSSDQQHEIRSPAENNCLQNFSLLLVDQKSIHDDCKKSVGLSSEVNNDSNKISLPILFNASSAPLIQLSQLLSFINQASQLHIAPVIPAEKPKLTAPQLMSLIASKQKGFTSIAGCLHAAAQTIVARTKHTRVVVSELTHLHTLWNVHLTIPQPGLSQMEIQYAVQRVAPGNSNTLTDSLVMSESEQSLSGRVALRRLPDGGLRLDIEDQYSQIGQSLPRPEFETRVFEMLSECVNDSESDQGVTPISSGRSWRRISSGLLEAQHILLQNEIRTLIKRDAFFLSSLAQRSASSNGHIEHVIIPNPSSVLASSPEWTKAYQEAFVECHVEPDLVNVQLAGFNPILIRFSRSTTIDGGCTGFSIDELDTSTNNLLETYAIQLLLELQSLDLTLVTFQKPQGATKLEDPDLKPNAPRHFNLFCVIGDSSGRGQFVDRKRDSSKQYCILDTIIQIVSHKRIAADLILVLEKRKLPFNVLILSSNSSLISIELCPISEDITPATLLVTIVGCHLIVDVSDMPDNLHSTPALQENIISDLTSKSRRCLSLRAATVFSLRRLLEFLDSWALSIRDS